MQEEDNKKTKRIKQISVTKLFGMFDHTVPLNLEDRITIIHGPNGFGKTAILRLIKSLFSQSNTVLREVPFDELRIDFDDNTSFWITKTAQTSQSVEKEENTQIITFNATGRLPFLLSSKYSLSQTRRSLFERTAPVTRVGPRTWRDDFTDEELTMEDVVERYGDKVLPEVIIEKEPEWLTEMRRVLPIRLIETQRLLNSSIRSSRFPEYDKIRQTRRPAMIPTVTKFSEEIARLIERKIAESATLAQSLDRTFPARVFRPTTEQRNVSDHELRDRLTKLEKKRLSLMAISLLDQDNSEAFQMDNYMDDNKRAMLSVYVEDAERKLEVFDEMADKIDLLTKIINKRFLYKKMSITREQGFVFTTDNGMLESLSSGEQHELVLFYEMLFKVASGSLILVDEPELSLHVVWQMEFLRDLQEITKLASLDVLLATHSPQIINDRWDLTVELKGPNN
ncbi:MAG: AAA family ATPase [Ktedonobacteraceae bacterium]|nr:AAA family ATPase [Ktedonobacteraceae bacterium]